jgi:hypothetical protein
VRNLRRRAARFSAKFEWTLEVFSGGTKNHCACVDDASQTIARKCCCHTAVARPSFAGKPNREERREVAKPLSVENLKDSSALADRIVRRVARETDANVRAGSLYRITIR